MREHIIELNELEEKFYSANEQLIEQFSKQGIIERQTLKEIYEFYKERKDLFHYAQAQLGLARFLDFSLINSQLFLNQVRQIASLALQIIQIYHGG